MTLTVNGERRSVADGLTVAGLLGSLGLVPAATIVELNRTILDRAAYATRRLSDGDVLELVRFVGGG